MARRSVAIYTVLTNYHDNPKPINVRGADCFMFTDDLRNVMPGWHGIEVERTDCQRLQRKIKILGHPVLYGYDVTVYIDASMTVKRNLKMLIDRFNGGMWIGSHDRNCVYDEGEQVKELGKADPMAVDAQMQWYRDMGFPKNFGMYSAGFIIRDKSADEMCGIWHETLERFTHRDQLSLPYALHCTGLKPFAIPFKNYVTIHRHKRKTAPEPMKIFYSTPYRSDKNIGKANNDFIELLPENAWVCITDGDACFLDPDWGSKVEKVVRANGHNFGLIGCVTNRLGGEHQLYKNEFNEDMDTINHIDIPETIWQENGTTVEETSGVAGVFMLFNKEIWKRAGGFKEGTITADTEFNRSIRKLRLKIGLAKGIYIFHNYRLSQHGNGRRKAQQDVKHLL